MFLIRWLWKNMRGYRRKYILAVFMSVVAQVLVVCNPFIMKTVVDTFISGEDAAKNLAEKQNLLFFLIGLTVGINFIRTAIQYSVYMLYEHCSQGTVYQVKKYLYGNMQKQDARFYDYYRTGDIMTRLSGDVEMVRHVTAWSIRAFIECIIVFGAAVVFYFTMDVLMALCMISLTPVIIFTEALFIKKAGPLFGDMRERLSDLNTAAEENISGNRVVKAFAAEDFEIDKFDGFNGDYALANKKTSITWWKFFLPAETFSQAVMVVLLVAGGLFVISGRLSFGDYIAFSGLQWAMSGPMSTMGYIISDFKRFSASANKIVEVYYSRSTIADRTDAVEIKGRIKGDIEFRNVSFGYDVSEKKEVLSNINFKIKAGQTVALMGETGSGKTTLVNLIPRVYDTSCGEILIDGHDVRMLKLEQLRSATALATQDVLLYSDTVEGNIAFGTPDMVLEDIKSSAAAAGAHEFIEKMPESYDTIIGERGVGLSGGQKQRIALARALAVKPSVLILDDTTSAVDSETEKYIQDSLRNLDFPCTKIIIAARISSAKSADMIIVLKDGKIFESGTHEELINNNGYYREVYELQL